MFFKGFELGFEQCSVYCPYGFSLNKPYTSLLPVFSTHRFFGHNYNAAAHVWTSLATLEV